MAIIQSPRVEGSDFERLQPVRLAKGMYGALLSRYSLPKIYPKFNSQETEEKFGLTFVITHDRAGRPLPQNSEGFIMVRNKLYWDGVKMSSLVGVLYALHGGKKTYDELAQNDVYDYDNFVGRPVMLFVEPAAKPDKHGIIANKITGIQPVDAEMMKAMQPVWKAAKIEKSEKTDRSYLASPKAEFEQAGAAPTPSNTVPDDSELDEIPF